ncbi:HAD family hydrolase [Streptomyces sp. RB6PN25]|uniref:HAD family hydrolase n=1 Tax=Streptomyces humicola TaxID=2953240 RepID=A0ABT1PQC3_9ACTN|nr:HAD family hydrolase [Streptomyces humicola]MCQ4079328.1 HAD family hydrolase [Streptomyces humicola]
MSDRMHDRPAAFLLDLDGTLVDSVYAHVISWQQALSEIGIGLSIWRIHRKIGMSGGLLVQAMLRETGQRLTPEETEHLQNAHHRRFADWIDTIRPLPGAPELLRHLTNCGIPWTIATSARRDDATPMLAKLGVPPDHPTVTREEVTRAKPDPDLFLAGAARLDIPPRDCVVVGDSVWDLLAARRADALGVGLLSGGYGQEELERAQAFRVYADPADLLTHIDELGIRGAQGD